MSDPLFVLAGTPVWLRMQGDDRQIAAEVGMASTNGLALALVFDGLIGGYAGMMPIGWDDGRYVDLIRRRPVTVTVREHAE